MHALRHTAASAWLAAGVGITAVAAWLGDTEQTILATYAHLMPDDGDRGRKPWTCFSPGVPQMCPQQGSGDVPPQVSALRVHFRWK